MKRARQILVFPFEVLLAVGVLLHVAVTLTCMALGYLCRMVEGRG